MSVEVSRRKNFSPQELLPELSSLKTFSSIRSLQAASTPDSGQKNPQRKNFFTSWRWRQLIFARIAAYGSARRMIQDALRALPSTAFAFEPRMPKQRYELARFKTVKVHIDYHVEVDGHRYSVPHPLVGQVLEARLTQHGVELLLRGQRVAAHVRSSLRGKFTTVDAHMPAAHRAHLEWTPQRLIEWGQQIGMACGAPPSRQWQGAAGKPHSSELAAAGPTGLIR